MTRSTSTTSFARFASAAAIVALAGLVAMTWRGDNAEACAGWEPSIGDMTTFDPGVLGDDSWGGLAYDPFDASYGGPCDACLTKAMADDWHGFLKDTVTPADWEQVLNKASLKDIFAIEERLAGKATPAPKGYETSSLWRTTPAPPALASAVEFVELLKRMEPQVTFAIWSDKPAPEPGTTLAKELAAAQRGLKAAKEPFLQQRYAFAILRALFYRHDWPGAIAFYDKSLAVLSAPSTDLKWRARYYVAGALRRDGKASRANLELARTHAGYVPLAGMALLDFRPAEEADWKESLAATKDAKERAALWSMVGIKHDPLVGAQEILKLDPTSPLVPLLVVRELSKVESTGVQQPDAAHATAERQGYARIEALATKILAITGVAKPYVYELVLAHTAAKRGDVAAARTHAQKAIALAPRDRRVTSQAKASLAVALAANWKIDPQAEKELATTLAAIDPSFARMKTVSNEVRTKLAFAYAAANKIVEAEFLSSSVTDIYGGANTTLEEKLAAQWASAPFIESLIARTDQRSTEFDRFVLADSHAKEELQTELAIRHVFDGDFAAAKHVYDTTQAKSDLLHTDPFVIHVIDCHDCDHDKYGAKATWTHRSLIARLVELEADAQKCLEPGAQAALALGNAMYNVTDNGNARMFVNGTHQSTLDARLAERFYKQAYDGTTRRELKAQAAWLAAKAELGVMIFTEQSKHPADGVDAATLIPTTWFPAFKKLADTAYYKDVLKECGRFRTWTGRP